MRRSAWYVTLAAAVAFQCSAEEPPAKAPAAPKTEEEAEEREEDLLAAMRLEERDFPLLVWSAYRISLDYYDPSRFDAAAQIASALEFVGLHTPEFLARVDGRSIEVTIGNDKRTFDMGDAVGVRQAVEVLEPILAFARDSLDLSDEPVHELEYAAINGFVAPLDPHTILLTPEQHADLGVKTRGRFGGIGARIGVKDRRIHVASVLPGSPAERAGLKGGDLMLKISGQSTVNMTPGEAQELLRGPEGTDVVVEVRRGSEKLSITITRGTITIDSVEASRLKTPEGDVGYVRVRQFQQDTAKRFEAELGKFLEAGVPIAGLVIDLRGNEGGLLTQATAMLDLMVDGGELVIVRSASGREHEDAAPEMLLPADVPVVALVDEGSASASEIVAGGVKHLARGVVVGRGSFGKGSVQMLKPWDPYGRELALKTTVAEYRVAGERRIQTSGVNPDVRLYPVALADVEGVGQIFDLERFERQRQRSIIAGQPSAKHELGGNFATPSRHVIRFVTSVPEPGAPPDSDPEIRIARDLVIAARGQAGRRQILARVQEAVPALAKREDEAIAAAVDARWNGAMAGAWGSPDADTEHPLEVTVERIGGDGNEIAAGQPFTLRVRVTNPGTSAAERVHLLTDCPHDEIDGIEVLMGRLEPGASTHQDLMMAFATFRPDLHTRLQVAAHVGEPDAAPDGVAAIGLDIGGGGRPSYSMDWWIVDDPALVARSPSRPPVELFPGDEPFTVSGNGDGVLQPDERVLIAFELTNLGPGRSPRASAVVRNLSGRQGLLEEGQVPIGVLESGASFSGAFGFTVAKEPLPGLPLELQLTAGDAVMRERIQHKVRLSIGALGEAPPTVAKAKGKVETVDEVVVRSGARSDAPILTSLPAKTTLSLEARAPGFVAVSMAGKRRGWIADSGVKDGGGGGTRPDAPATIFPPTLVLDETPRATQDASLAISGTATHHERVRDVVIWVRGEGPHARDRKVWYGANPGDGGQWQFRGDVPLSKGANRIRVIARDADRVERWRDVWVHRGDG